MRKAMRQAKLGREEERRRRNQEEGRCSGEGVDGEREREVSVSVCRWRGSNAKRQNMARVAERRSSPPFFDPSFAFLPDRERECIHLVDGCNGLLLFRCFMFADDPCEFDYLVINPAMEKWVVVPVSRQWSNQVGVARLGFDPAISSHFYVFEF
ncbi:hypothetical protein PR202_ga12362 [Eleusine coracana subsp. coracana]|uniref:F-box protein n=1 Tax=Eleusine coracana subsp. coracana TaxID=191504 RepID=A0AAV5CC00_ELECO|nr:hypothetical protein PR202_ga12362 [Eleusine coracana subsp. coracana]